ncbi:MAG: hypothetical protein LBL46_05165 [Rickettsiales bacterium]|nr:hypothetical protein [Rickettsiales bacterium]
MELECRTQTPSDGQVLLHRQYFFSPLPFGPATIVVPLPKLSAQALMPLATIV